MIDLLRKYRPHWGQQAFHYYVQEVYQYVLMSCGIRGGKTYSGAREATKQAFNSTGPGVFGIIAPTYSMLKRTTWVEFKEAARHLIAPKGVNDSDFIITLRNGRRVHGHTADRADRIRNETFVGAWVDEARECKNFANLWNVLLGRVLSTRGKIFVTTSPNSYDDIHEIFIEKKNKKYGVVRFPTFENTYIDKDAIYELEGLYDPKFARQELYGEVVIFEGAVYYTFNRKKNAGDLALRLARYDPGSPIWLCCDFNVDPMAWVITQPGFQTVKDKNGAETDLKTVFAVDEIYLRNSNTIECCREFRDRYRYHKSGLVLYGDATGKARHTDSNITNWKIIENELSSFGIKSCVPSANPAERDRVNAVNGLIHNSRDERRFLINPEKCRHTIRDFEQVAYKDGSTQIDKKNATLTHASDAVGYMVEKEFSLNKGQYKGLRI